MKEAKDKSKKIIGVIRRIDGLGRVTIPVEMRNKLDWQEKDPVNVLIEGNKVTFEKVESNELEKEKIN